MTWNFSIFDCVLNYYDPRWSTANSPGSSRHVFKLIDLGYAKEVDPLSVCSSLLGSFHYVAPELFTSREYLSTVDYWSLGNVAHECLTGSRPFLLNSSWGDDVSSCRTRGPRPQVRVIFLLLLSLTTDWKLGESAYSLGLWHFETKCNVHNFNFQPRKAPI